MRCLSKHSASMNISKITGLIYGPRGIKVPKKSNGFISLLDVHDLEVSAKILLYPAWLR